MPPQNKASPLQRGSACLCCRKRKMKCDGTRPACGQCIKAHRADDCEFDDTYRKSRTQMLQEKVDSLEEKLRKLEAVSASPPSGSSRPRKLSETTLHPSLYRFDHADGQEIEMGGIQLNSPFTFDDLAHNSLEATFDFSGSPEMLNDSVFDFLQPLSQTGSPTLTAVSPKEQFKTDSPKAHHRFSSNSPQLNADHPSLYSKQVLLEIFLSHRHQCSFDIDIGRFQSFDRQPHPALMNAIYLIACHFSQSPWFAELESYFFKEASSAIATALENSDRLVDIVSASCLVAVYQYANCRPIEGYRHAFSAARLAISLGLHQISREQFSVEDQHSPSASSSRDIAELNDRISVFWQVFDVDRSWSVAHGLPSALSDDTSDMLMIKTPWPKPKTPSGMDVFSSAPSILALRAEAVALYERAYRLSSCRSNSFTARELHSDSLTAFLRDTKFWTQRQELERCIERFALVLPPLFGQDDWGNKVESIDPELFAVHAMVNAATVYLQRDLVSTSMSACTSCLKAAHFVSSQARQLKEGDYQFLDPIISICWNLVGKLYIHLIVISNKSGGNAQHTEGIAQELSVLLLALKRLGKIFPIADQYATLLEEERARKCITVSAD